MTPHRDRTRFWQRASLRQILIDPAYTPVVSKLATNSPALHAGIQRGDEIHEADGIKLYHLLGLITHINREVMHHGAEICLLRDLHRAGLAMP